MWLKSYTEDNFLNAQYIGLYPEMAIEKLQTALVRAIMLLGNTESAIDEDQAAEAEGVLLNFLHDIRTTKFISVGFPEKLEELIEKQNANE